MSGILAAACCCQAGLPCLTCYPNIPIRCPANSVCGSYFASCDNGFSYGRGCLADLDHPCNRPSKIIFPMRLSPRMCVDTNWISGDGVQDFGMVLYYPDHTPRFQRADSCPTFSHTFSWTLNPIQTIAPPGMVDIANTCDTSTRHPLVYTDQIGFWSIRVEASAIHDYCGIYITLFVQLFRSLCVPSDYYPYPPTCKPMEVAGATIGFNYMRTNTTDCPLHGEFSLNKTDTVSANRLVFNTPFAWNPATGIGCDPVTVPCQYKEWEPGTDHPPEWHVPGDCYQTVPWGQTGWDIPTTMYVPIP